MRLGSRPTPSGPPSTVLGEDLRRRLERILRTGARRHAGLAVAVRIDDRTATFGRGTVAEGVEGPPDAATIFEIGSVTKVVTATLLAEMSVAGLVGLDDPVQRHLPEGVHLRAGDGPPPTLADLASHTAGLPRLPPGLLLRALRHRDDPYADFGHVDLWQAVERTRPRRSPDGLPRYSNFGFGLLGEVLAHRAGATYADLVRERVTGPLGMHDTHVEVPEPLRGRLAQGHNRRGDPVPGWRMPALAGAGGLHSTARDLMRLVNLHLDGGHTPLHRAAALTAVPRAGGRVAVGLGWHLMPLPGRWRRVLWHNGGTGGFRAFVGVVRESRSAVVVLANSAVPVDHLGLKLLRVLDAESGVPEGLPAGDYLGRLQNVIWRAGVGAPAPWQAGGGRRERAARR